VYAFASHLFLCHCFMKKICLSAVLLTLLCHSAFANQQLDSLKYISAAGAPFLTLKMLDQAQPGVDQDLYEWILWEQERFEILTQWKQWNPLLVRIESLPKDLPEQFQQQAASYQIRAYIELGQNNTARKLLRERLWNVDAGSSSEYKNWRQLLIETYLNENRIEDARVAMLRFQQDFQQGDKDWILLRARVLMQARRYDEAIEVLSTQLSWKALAMKLLAEYRNRQHSAQTLWDLCEKHISSIKDDPEQLATYWAIASIAAQDISPSKQVIALEARLELDVEKVDKLYEITPDQLWQAYFDYAQMVGNRSELLMGDDASWLQLALKVAKPTPVKSRSLLAFLMIQSNQPEIRKQAASAFLKSLNPDNVQHQYLLENLFNHSDRFSEADSIPVEIRFQLVDQALKRADIAGATRLMSGLHSIPADTREFDWLLRQARVLLLGGKYDQGNQTLEALFKIYTDPNKEDTDHILQVLFDLQTLGENEQAIAHFRRLMALPIDPRQKREILFWMADSFKGLEQYERAALLYLQSAMFIGPDAMDPWAQTARFNAAESLQKAGLVDDARRIYQSLLAVTEEPARRSVLRHNIQQLWLTQSTR
jgi:hypothetical protein